MRIEYLRKKMSEHAVPKTMKGNVEVFINDKLPKNVDINEFIEMVHKAIPSYFFDHIDSINIGNYDFLLKNNLNSYYKDGKIYISSEKETTMHLAYDLFHEIAHSLEKPHGDLIYKDGELKEEFLKKRETLQRFLNIYYPKTKAYRFDNEEYDEELDRMLHSLIGYDRLRSFTDGIFLNPYSATSLREYFASGLEHYLEGNREKLDRMCPVLYNKIKLLFNR
jgi:hypothetical protein|tara:strand:- start:81 stop:746 length:666 start_codon:yes stop_codon:yes gene_type:complete